MPGAFDASAEFGHDPLPTAEEILGDELEALEGRPDVEALDVMAIEDLDSMLAILEETGRLFSELLAAKAAAAGPRGDVRTWISKDRAVPNFARSRYLDAALTEILGAIGLLFGLEGLDEDDPSTSAA